MIYLFLYLTFSSFTLASSSTLLNVHPGCLFSLLLSSPWYITALGCLSNLHWWISRLPPTFCHYKWHHNEHLQTRPLKGLYEVLLGNIHRVYFTMTKLCQIALQKGCSWQHSQQQCINPLQTIGVLQLSNCESTAPQSFPCPIILLLSVYCFCFRFPLSPGIDKLLQRPIPSFFLISRPLLMVSSYSWLLLPSESCLSVLPSNPLIVL